MICVDYWLGAPSGFDSAQPCERPTGIPRGVRLPVENRHDALTDVSARVVDEVLGFTARVIFGVREMVDTYALPRFQRVLYDAVAVRVDVSDTLRRFGYDDLRTGRGDIDAGLPT